MYEVEYVCFVCIFFLLGEFLREGNRGGESLKYKNGKYNKCSTANQISTFIY